MTLLGRRYTNVASELSIEQNPQRFVYGGAEQAHGQDHLPLYVDLAAVHGQLDARELVKWILADRLPVRVNLQLHKFIWGADTQGV